MASIPITLDTQTLWIKRDNQHIIFMPHREDGPAIEHNNGDREWYLDGELHRDGGPAIEYQDGEQYWYHYGELRRVKREGLDQYWLEGKLHREDGPAVNHNGKDEWWYQGHQLSCTTPQEFDDLMQLRLLW